MQNRFTARALTRPLRIARVENVQQQIGLAQLFQRRAKCVDEILRKVGDEADRVGHPNVRARCEIGAPHRRVERRKRLVGDERVAARQRVEQRRLADVRVSDQRDERFACGRARRSAR